jgi:hypothetical protein
MGAPRRCYGDSVLNSGGRKVRDQTSDTPVLRRHPLLDLLEIGGEPFGGTARGIAWRLPDHLVQSCRVVLQHRAAEGFLRAKVVGARALGHCGSLGHLPDAGGRITALVKDSRARLDQEVALRRVHRECHFDCLA